MRTRGVSPRSFITLPNILAGHEVIGGGNEPPPLVCLIQRASALWSYGNAGIRLYGDAFLWCACMCIFLSKYAAAAFVQRVYNAVFGASNRKAVSP